MKCPYCNKEMEKGLIQSPQEIAWYSGDSRRFFNNSDFHEGSVTLSERSLLKGSAVTAWLCRDCKKVVIDYGDENSDLNN